MTGRDRKSEEAHLKGCQNAIRDNVRRYSAKLKELGAQTKEMYDQYRSSDESLHNDLVVGLDLQSQLGELLRKNEAALSKPYFGRIDYTEDKDYALYIGKNGIRKNLSDVLIVDWRAPIATLYYEGDVGEGAYRSPTGEEVPVVLHLKRTFEIDGGKLVDYYDTDVIANDEFLTKYLSQNKDVVLGEIIATIQKEQNQVIRDAPWHSVIVQGVAGSGKTTVAMHRISYLLYNYKERFKPQEFYVIGSNKMLLNYITGVLPSLDVDGVKQMTMEELLWESLEGDFAVAKSKRRAPSQELHGAEGLNADACGRKGSCEFALSLEEYYRQKEKEALASGPVLFQGEEAYAVSDVENFLKTFSKLSLEEKVDSLNERVLYRIRARLEGQGAEPSLIRKELGGYKSCFEERVNALEVFRGKGKNPKKLRLSLEGVYEDYLAWYAKEKEERLGRVLLGRFQERKLDLVDLAMLNLIKRRLKKSEGYERISHMVVDEAQDFGSVVFYALKETFQDCTYTIMGDVSQNIHYDTGMNDWSELRGMVFKPERDRFYVLAKSYRNTVEISDYAGGILEKCSFETYRTQPVIRHGREVGAVRLDSEAKLMEEAAKRVEDMQERGYRTIAIICRDEKEAAAVRGSVGKRVKVNEGEFENLYYQTGIMVLPIRLTKGLEFDSVVLYNPNQTKYPKTEANAKLLYVAITRALHELCIVYEGELSEWLG